MSEQLAAHTPFRVRTIIEVLGKPKEHVEKTLKAYIEKIKTDEHYVIMSETFSDAEEQDDKLFSVYAELEMVAKGFDHLVRFCFDYMPSSLEIVKPEKATVTNFLFAQLFNDLQTRLHNVDMIVKQQRNENDFLKKNLHVSLKNSIMLALTEPLSQDRLAKRIGMEPKELGLFLKELQEEQKISKDGEHYKRAAKKGQTQAKD